MTNRETKLDIIQALSNRDVYFKQVNDVEYRTRCPYCGDSMNNLNTGHMYIRINPDDNFNIVYHCFKCEESGIMTADVLSALDIDDVDIKSGLYTLNKTAKRADNKNIVSGVQNIYFDYKLPEIKLGKKTEYIENRLGIKFSKDDFKKMKVITSLKDFLILNDIKSITCDRYIANAIERDCVGFLSFGNSHILFRDITNRGAIRWFKYPITNESRKNRLFYSMAGSVDPLASEKIQINLAEGVMDTLSECYNLGFDDSNIMHISVSGKYYDRILLYLVDLGLVGSNITINIFADNDAQYNSKNNNPTDINYFRNLLKKYKHLYGEVNIYYNTMGKDIGVPRDEINLKRYML
jgi:hypothetical protein